MPATEAALTSSCIKLINERGGYARKNHGDSRVRKGRPDIDGAYRGHFLGLEVKLPTNKSGTSRLREAELKAIAAAGGIARVITSTTQVVQLLDAIDAKYYKQQARGRGAG